ncbi:unnamed protein product [Rotaria magnacalcarata]|uniref:Uncharacterized protein n=1 Tax=Rotaria magnacalcarata TaxID=392030 RepID=A0A816UP73_9BILA|nr:unnamed protein product [Rotaria magnacalcarata]
MDITTDNQYNTNNVNQNNNTGENHQSLQILTTGEQQMSALHYCRQVSKEITLAIDALEPALKGLAISSELGDLYLKTLAISSYNGADTNAREPLTKLLNIFQLASEILPLFRPINDKDDHNSAFAIGQEINETYEKTITAPSEQNDSQLNREIQAEIPSNLSTSAVSKDFYPTTLPSPLSQVLSQAYHYAQAMILAKLEISEQPQKFWRKRTINCLKKKWCPVIQGQSGKQRHYIGIQWSKLIDSNSNNLFVFVQLLSYDDQPHQSKILVPPDTTVKSLKSSGKGQKIKSRRQTISDLVIQDKYGFDKLTNTILCPISEKEYSRCKKDLKVIMFSLYKETEDDDDDDDDDDDHEDVNIEFQLQKLCKLRICLCQRTCSNTLEYISNFIDTEWIEESKGKEPLAIDPMNIIPKKLCTCGNEIITVQLNTDSEKNGFVVCLNDEKLSLSQVHGVRDKQISFKSRPNIIPKQDALNIMISKKSLSETIKQNHNPYNGLDEDTLLNFSIPYIENSDNPHDHKNSII